MKLFSRLRAGKPAEPGPGKAAGLAFLLEGATQTPSVPLEATLFAWVMRDVAPWRLHPMERATLRERLVAVNDTRVWASVFQIAHQRVAVLPKPAAVAQTTGFKLRTEQYRGFFETIAPRLPADFTTMFCMSMKDYPTEDIGAPQFAFQKKRGAAHVLLPDVDFLLNDFYSSAANDPLPFSKKQPRAVFSGSTTGRMISTEIAAALASPRLAAAQYFNGNDAVDFRLPVVTQCTTEEAKALLQAQPFCQKPRLDWQEQLAHRFIISLDGNGATCSRVAQALLSNSVLLKYDSDHVLYYFDGLQPWLHYVPVAEHADVEKIMALAAASPARFEQIAAASKAFAQTYLTRQAAAQYTMMLLKAYEASFTGA